MPARLLLLLALLALPFAASSAPRNPATKKVEITCAVLDEGKHLDEYFIIIYCDNNLSDTIFVDKKKTVVFYLNYGHQYAIRHIAGGYRDRVVMINTCVDTKTAQVEHFFDYELEMIATDEPVNTLNDLPVAVVRYDAQLKKFDYSRQYALQVRKQPDLVVKNN
jgi:hypothetical protein